MGSGERAEPSVDIVLGRADAGGRVMRRGRHRCLVGLMTVSALVACDGSLAPADGGSDAEPPARDAGAGPAEPARPDLGPCPPGWREVTGAEGTTCDPYPAEGPRTDCAADGAHFPGEPGCARVGTECAASGWPEGLPPDRRAIYVRAGSTGGDGTSTDSPLQTITEALERASAGDVVAVAEGSYDEAIVIGAGVTVWGACVAATRLTSSTPSEEEGVVGVAGAGAELRNVSIAGAARPGVFIASPESSLTLEGVVIADVVNFGVAADAGRVDGRDVIIRDVAPRPRDGAMGRGVALFEAQITLERAVIERTTSAAAWAAGAGGVLTLSDTRIHDVRDRADGQLGRGAEVQRGARLVLSRVLVERARESGVVAFSAESMVELSDVVVRDTLGRGDGRYGMGVQIHEGAGAVASRVLVERSRTHGVSVEGAGASLEASDIVVRDTSAEAASGANGAGLVVLAGASVAVARAVVARSRHAGIGVDGAGTRVSLTDVTIDEVAGDAATGRFGVGLWAQNDAIVAAQRLAVASSRMAGAGALTGASMTLEDARIAGVRPADCAESTCPDESAGMGVVAHLLGGRVRVTRFSIEGAALCGVAVGRSDTISDDPGGQLDLEDGVIEGSPVGACVQVDGYDAARLRASVRYVDVGVPLQATSYELPGLLGTP